MDKWSYWVHIPAWRRAVAASPKCGSRSVLLTIVRHFYPWEKYETAKPSVYKAKTENYQYLNRRGVDPSWSKLIFLRDPVERFVSLWARHCRDDIPGIPRHLRGNASQKTLIDFIAANLYQDPHWAPQAHTIGRHDGPVNYCMLPDASAAWANFMPEGVPSLEFVNVTQKAANLGEGIDTKIRSLYADDFKLIEEANARHHN